MYVCIVLRSWICFWNTLREDSLAMISLSDCSTSALIAQCLIWSVKVTLSFVLYSQGDNIKVRIVTVRLVLRNEFERSSQLSYESKSSWLAHARIELMLTNCLPFLLWSLSAVVASHNSLDTKCLNRSYILKTYIGACTRILR